MKNRIGKFYVASTFLETTKHLDTLGNILATLKFIPTKVEFLYQYDKFEYIGISYMFSECNLGCEIPEYALTVTNNGSTIGVQKI